VIERRQDSSAVAAAVAAGPDDKGPGAYRTISEVANELGVPQHVLRFWESRFAQLRPMKRGGGRRYYRPEDVDLLRKIRGWLYEEGLTVKGVQRRLRGRGAKQALALPDTIADIGDVPLPGEAGARTANAPSGPTLKELEAILAALRAMRAEL
jgi:DNA-binding transcriptional MerR regulator